MPLADLQRGLRNLVRADLFSLLAFYFLTLFEFLFPQANYDTLVTAHATVKAVVICLWAFAGLAMGRHFVKARPQPFRRILTTPISSGRMMALFLGCTLFGYMHMLVAVNFNVFDMVDAFIGPRFSQPWARGRLGDWKALFEELGMVHVPHPAHVRHHAGAAEGLPFRSRLALVVVILLFTLFYGYTSGTRHIFDSYLVTFLIGYAFATRKARRHELLYVAALCVALLIFSTITMTKFREFGLKQYLKGGVIDVEPMRNGEILSVDLNLFPMSRLAEVFPEHHPYLGFEIIYQALIRPIPRAIWKGKPEGMSVSIEDAVGADGWTVAASFAGEAYMSGGYIAVFLIAAGFSWIAAWWNLLVSEDNSQLGVLIYASGFFSVVISMRSMLVFTTAILPTLAAFALGFLCDRQGRGRGATGPARPAQNAGRDAWPPSRGDEAARGGTERASHARRRRDFHERLPAIARARRAAGLEVEIFGPEPAGALGAEWGELPMPRFFRKWGPPRLGLRRALRRAWPRPRRMCCMFMGYGCTLPWRPAPSRRRAWSRRTACWTRGP